MRYPFATKAAATVVLATGFLFAQKQPQPKSQKEVDALQAVFQTQDPDARITAVENLLSKFADTEFKAIALQVAAMSAQQKNDFDKMVIYAERTLEADPKNYSAKLMLASGIAQRTKEFDLDREEKLKRAEGYAKSAMEDIKTAAKPRPDITDEQWEGARKDFTSQAHEALGVAAMVRKNYAGAASELKMAIDAAAQPDPATMVRLAAAYNALSQPDNAIAVLDKLGTVSNVPAVITNAAQAERNNSVKLKGGGAAKPAAPPAGAAPGGTSAPATPVTPTPAPAK